MSNSLTLYEKIANGIENQIKNGTLKMGDRLPSLRTVCEENKVSMNTALQAFYTLEARGLIEPKPQSGFYVSFAHHRFPQLPETTKPQFVHGTEDIGDIIDALSNNKKQTKINFAQGTPDLELLPVAKLNKATMEAMRQLKDSGVSYSHEGSYNLKRQIAKRTLQWGGKLKANEIITTSGSMEAIAFCMMAVAKPGDTIAVESPVFYGILQLATNLSLKVLELPTNAVTGIELPALENALKKKKINLCLLVSNFNNPLGSCMPTENKKFVVSLLEKYNVPLIEDDLYGDIYLGDSRPKTCKTFDESGMVMWCSSLSKTLVSGYRVGWVSAGKFSDRVNRIRRCFSVSVNTLSHEATSIFLEKERFDAHLKKFRQTLRVNMLNYLHCISEHFPADTKVSRPQGGFFLWVELSKNADMLELYDRALQNKISIAPGNIYTLQKQYRNCFRLNYGLQWNDRTESALKLLGRIVSR